MADPALIGPMIESIAQRLWDEDHPDGPVWERASLDNYAQRPYIKDACKILWRRQQAGVRVG